MTGQAFDSHREAETLSQCDAILAALTQLESLIKAGPRLTAARESRRADAFREVRFDYADLADHCRRNLKGW
jgi:hypothetical protein